VLPVAGEVRLDIEGKAGRLDPLHGALVAPGAWHAQCRAVSNRSLILDVAAGTITHGAWQRCWLGSKANPVCRGPRTPWPAAPVSASAACMRCSVKNLTPARTHGCSANGWNRRAPGWPALALLVAGVLSCARAHRQQPLP
jgi:hypothetical protein